MERLIVMRMVRAIITNDHVGLKTQSESEGRSPPTFLSAFFSSSFLTKDKIC